MDAPETGSTAVPGEIVPAGDAPQVHVYWRPGCPFCMTLRGQLRRAGLPTVEHDIWSDADAAAVVRHHANGNETVPTVIIGDLALVNPGAATVVSRAAEVGVVATPKPHALGRLRMAMGIGLTVVALLLGACASSSASKAAPSFTAKTVSGGQLSSASFKGKATVLWFWAPWCTVCAGEAPGVAAVARANAGNVTFVGVAGRGKVPAMQTFVSKHGLGFENAVDDDGAIWADFGVAAQPAFAFIDRNGRVTTSLKALNQSQLEAKVKALDAA
jgi:peroxiredoxin/glutaredoxin